MDGGITALEEREVGCIQEWSLWLIRLPLDFASPIDRRTPDELNNRMTGRILGSTQGFPNQSSTA